MTISKMKPFEENSNEQITLRIEGKLLVFNSRDLIIVAGDEQYTKFFIKNKKVYTSSYHLGHFKDLIDRCELQKVHRSYFINMSKVDEYEKSDETILMSNKERVPLAETYKKAFLKRLGPVS